MRRPVISVSQDQWETHRLKFVPPKAGATQSVPFNNSYLNSYLNGGNFGFVAPAFRRALWNQALARLKAGAT
jgi:hypothetical protein